MKEQFPSSSATPETQKREPKKELVVERQDLMEAKRTYLEGLKGSVKEMFGTEELPKELVEEMLAIRKDVKEEIINNEYSEKIDVQVDQKIKTLMFRMTHYKQETKKVEAIEEDEEGNIKAIFEDGTEEDIPEPDKELLESLRLYFDSYRLAHNAAQFRKNVSDLQGLMVQENEARKLNFYSKDEKSEVLVEKVFEKYKQAGFEKEEIAELIQTCNLEKLDTLEIQDLRLFTKIRDVFSRFIGGDKSKYVGLSAALMVPAFLEGYAPMFLANAFKENQIDMTQVGLFALLSVVSAGGSALINKQFKEFLDRNFSKKEGFGEYIAENVSEFPGTEVGEFGMERIKSRIAHAKESYEEILRKISFDVLPATVTLATSAAMLYEKSPILAAGTVAGTGMMMVIDRYVDKKGRFWEKERRATTEAEKMNQKMNELLNAHMEVILSGEKERFTEEMEELLASERVAMSDKQFMRVIRDKVAESTRMLNFIIAAITTYIAGGSADKFIAALVYSGNFSEGISTILGAKHDLLSSFRDIVQMEVMFNGYAEEEREKEKDRIGMSELPNHAITIRNVSVEFEKKKIIDDITIEIPEGALVSLEGVSGAGKTTLMKVLAGYYKPTQGTVEVGGTDMEKVKKSGSDSVYSKIAYLSQFPYILEDDVRSNLTFGISGEVVDAEVREILKEVGLHERFPNLKEKLKGGRGDAGTTSGGETSRIGLARAILKMRKNGSKIVFLDEPTASVDEETAAEIAKIINNEKRRNPDVTFISISHDKHFREMLDTTQIVKMRRGKIEE